MALFKKNDLVQAKVIIGFTIKCRVIEKMAENGKSFYWLETFEEKPPFVLNERIIAAQTDLKMISPANE